jgi:hypothetical protein
MENHAPEQLENVIWHALIAGPKISSVTIENDDGFRTDWDQQCRVRTDKTRLLLRNSKAAAAGKN